MQSLIHTGPSSVERVTARHVALTIPSVLTLEITATGYTRIAWLQSGVTINMLDQPRLELEDYAKRLILNDTRDSDYGEYEVDVYTIGGEVLSLDFVVGRFGEFIHLQLHSCINASSSEYYIYCTT